ncbi:MAG: CsbD family protein [Flavipsychrobacter sp.]|jgi:uncharacterized protein YjbJ (UPF0337 family)|nr:CsbD family protein [Flavipsychrobacter sp.]
MSNTTTVEEVVIPATETIIPTVAETPVVITAATAVATEKIAPVQGNWNEQKGKLKAQFTTLTDADLHYENGKMDEMFTKIRLKIGKTKEELVAIIAAL